MFFFMIGTGNWWWENIQILYYFFIYIINKTFFFSLDGGMKTHPNDIGWDWKSHIKTFNPSTYVWYTLTQVGTTYEEVEWNAIFLGNLASRLVRTIDATFFFFGCVVITIKTFTTVWVRLNNFSFFWQMWGYDWKGAKNLMRGSLLVFIRGVCELS